MINLTANEREKFSAYLKQEAESTKGILKQMEFLGLPAEQTKARRLETVAYLLVAERLDTTEEQSIGVSQ